MLEEIHKNIPHGRERNECQQISLPPVHQFINGNITCEHGQINAWKCSFCNDIIHEYQNPSVVSPKCSSFFECRLFL